MKGFVDVVHSAFCIVLDNRIPAQHDEVSERDEFPVGPLPIEILLDPLVVMSRSAD
jgi:hypothetical protein